MKVMSIDLGLSKRSEKEEQMKDTEARVLSTGNLGTATQAKMGHCSEEECCAEEGRVPLAEWVEKGMAAGQLKLKTVQAKEVITLPLQARGLLEKIRMAHDKLDTVLASRSKSKDEMILWPSAMTETFMTLRMAHEEMDALLERLPLLEKWFIK